MHLSSYSIKNKGINLKKQHEKEHSKNSFKYYFYIWNSNHDFCFQGEPITTFKGITWKFRAENEGVKIMMVTNGIAFCTDSKGYLYAINCNTGALIWKFNAEIKLYDGPNINDNTAYLGTAKGVIFAIDILNGKGKWRIQTEGV